MVHREAMISNGPSRWLTEPLVHRDVTCQGAAICGNWLISRRSASSRGPSFDRNGADFHRKGHGVRGVRRGRTRGPGSFVFWKRASGAETRNRDPRWVMSAASPTLVPLAGQCVPCQQWPVALLSNPCRRGRRRWYGGHCQPGGGDDNSHRAARDSNGGERDGRWAKVPVQREVSGGVDPGDVVRAPGGPSPVQVWPRCAGRATRTVLTSVQPRGLGASQWGPAERHGVRPGESLFFE
mmetsp:Transcript_6556/g.16304  ORF Transcript_6556/g.16304 Transcript_6556/m.16304 type:complete len:238 (-) Transcript_6556:8-721(-)